MPQRNSACVRSRQDRHCCSSAGTLHFPTRSCGEVTRYSMAELLSTRRNSHEAGRKITRKFPLSSLTDRKTRNQEGHRRHERISLTEMSSPSRQQQNSSQRRTSFRTGCLPRCKVGSTGLNSLTVLLICRPPL